MALATGVLGGAFAASGTAVAAVGACAGLTVAMGFAAATATGLAAAEGAGRAAAGGGAAMSTAVGRCLGTYALILAVKVHGSHRSFGTRTSTRRAWRAVRSGGSLTVDESIV
jgi:hypothetical protein